MREERFKVGSEKRNVRLESRDVKRYSYVDVCDASGEIANVVIDKMVRIRDRLSRKNRNGSKNCK